ncbi:lipoyl(octanoyl) transferase LipB [Reichenbachiella agarivorans]|uniref:Octanoyltransferase n=1 Tax=Reichenbachiella agarivorans TaxID=2979464 RepID=A0ABY6CSX4_9BACT|nr:lipoyl(octanoyl) transferase LipB [Reichenbachiella agarivorans]UXP33621.1 lipoyl(octanoyl) transferase LipB [Reichenbachiella agarivorans]
MNHLINKETQFISLGLMDYQEAWDYQEKIFKETVDIKIANRNLPESDQVPTPNYLIFCQHPHVYTLGKSGKEENLLLDEQGLSEKDARYYKINRGGDITYHGPGQIVGYPILDLDNFFTDIHKYLRYLEEAIIMTCADYGVNAGRIDGLTGVWIDHETPSIARKICAMGVKSSRWVTMHGFAFNVSTDLHYFGNIIPCGIDDKAVTSLEKELQRKPDIQEVEYKLKGHLEELFGFVWG